MITVIVPFYNAESFISLLIDSLNEQEDDRFEVVFVDDNSDDDTVNLIRSKKQKYPFEIVSSASSGPGAARNTGVECARFDYITFVDSDDYVSSAFIKRFIEAIDDECCDIIESLFKVVSLPDYNVISVPDVEKFLNAESRFLQILMGDLPRTSWAKLFKKKFLIENKILYPDGILNGEDHVFLLKAYAAASSVGTVYEQLYFWVRRPGSLTQRVVTEKNITDFYSVSTIKKEMLKSVVNDFDFAVAYDGFVRRLFKEARALLRQISDAGNSSLLQSELIRLLTDTHFSDEVAYILESHPDYYYDVIELQYEK